MAQLPLATVISGDQQEHTLVHGNLALLHIVRRETDQDRVAAALATDDDCVAAKEAQVLHRLGVQEADRVVIVGRLVHHQAVRPGISLAPEGDSRSLLAEDRRRGGVVGNSLRSACS